MLTINQSEHGISIREYDQIKNEYGKIHKFWPNHLFSDPGDQQKFVEHLRKKYFEGDKKEVFKL